MYLLGQVFYCVAQIFISVLIFYIVISITKKRYVKKNSHYDGEFDYFSFNSVNFFNIYFEDQLTTFKSRSIVSSQ